ncbi:TetR/AcrR family transcriptional regulator [Desertihabitans aurantiacus]|uniref:TetR/AcrR family transcriptional regulator n=1 Tax=Desertihabitans aurantiacus TaxID=2282477 RepID=UPI000DF83400|nr:TetR/AcrR family transcriptional regulator [Desertihabitans aurantiacus]
MALTPTEGTSTATTRVEGAPTARRERTRLRLLDAAVQVFAERGVNGASVEEICERAGFTRGAFYSNFTSKEDLCLAVIRRRHEEHAAVAEQTISQVSMGDLSMDELIEQGVELFVRAQDTDPAAVVAAAELRLHAVRTPELRADYTELEDQQKALFARLLSAGLEGKGLPLRLEPNQLGLLGAVFESTLLEGVLHGTDVRDALKERLMAALRGLLVDARRQHRSER